MATFGGVILFATPAGNLSVRGSVTHNPINMSFEGVANHDGTVDRTASPQGYRFGLSLRNKDNVGAPIDVAALMALQDVTISFIKESEGVIETYSGAHLIGDPQIDDMTGEISGITGIAAGFLSRAA